MKGEHPHCSPETKSGFEEVIKYICKCNKGDSRKKKVHSWLPILFRNDLKLEPVAPIRQNGTDLNLLTSELIFPVI